MSKFSKKKDGEVPAVSTASLPDIVFMLLFFFMTVTVMKDSSLKILLNFVIMLVQPEKTFTYAD